MNILLIVISILFFSLVIFIHELGHFITAKMAKVKVNEFSLGMGPALFKFQKGETLYALRLFPIGGYCAMEGEDTESDNENAFSKKSVFWRILIVAAGAIMNIILAFVFMFVLLMQRNMFASTTIASFSEDAVTSQYGLQVGDTIKSIDGYGIMTYADINFKMATNKNFCSDIVVERDGNSVELKGVSYKKQQTETGKDIIVRDFLLKPINKNPWTFTVQAFKEMGSNIKMTYASFFSLITGQFSLNEVSGPVGLVAVIKDAASEGLKVNFVAALNNIIMVMMLLSINLGIFNLLPLPALDGGRLVFLILEAIIGKPVNPKYEGLIHGIGFLALVLLLVLVSINDVMKLFFGRGMVG